MPRTDNDSWDLATSVGATATMVAAGRAVASKAEEPLIDDPFAEPLVRAVGIEFLARWANGDVNAADIDGPDDVWGLQRMADLMGARTRYFDAFFRDAMDAGIRQAVILASGLDARAYRLQWPAGATVFEIDQPEVIQFKSATLADLGARPTADLREVPIDLRQDWPAALRAAGFDPSAPSAWIAEGLLAFLPADAQTACWTTSPTSAPRGAGWLPRSSATGRARTVSKRQMSSGSPPSAGAHTGSRWSLPTCATTWSATTWQLT